MTAERRTVLSPKLVIFDCDGVLVDSEPVNNRALGLLLLSYGLRLQPDELRTHFRGTANSRLQDIAMAHWGVSLPDDIADVLGMRSGSRWRRGSVRSQGSPTWRVWLALRGGDLCRLERFSRSDRTAAEAHGLYPLFAGRLFSAAEVARSKPYPDVFLHAAETLGFPPSECVVIEDSEPGIQAGRAAGMRVLAYAAGPDTAAADSAGVELFTDMALLPALLGL